MRIFLDANIFVAACGSAEGGSRYLFRIAEREESWHLLTSAYAIREARVNVRRAFLHAHAVLEELITTPSLTVVHPPPRLLLRATETIVQMKDVPILAAAVFARADFLCTLDQKDFHKERVRNWCRQFSMEIIFPKDLLLQWRREQKN